MASLQSLLDKTSRTFALNIPFLPEPTQAEVTIAYLLFRIADTFEDATSWTPDRRIEALHDFSNLLSECNEADADRLTLAWMKDPPTDHNGYLDLLSHTPFVINRLAALNTVARDIVRIHTVRTATGMAGIVARTRDRCELELHDMEDLQRYCYIVAGIVGEMLTELFLLGRDHLLARAPYLRERSHLFGEGLQLTNILKDADDDQDKGRQFLPAAVKRSDVFTQARLGLVAACEYTLALQEARAARGIVSFNALPVMLAWATVDKVERQGPGSKLTRLAVSAIIKKMNRALEQDAPVFDLAEVSSMSGAGYML